MGEVYAWGSNEEPQLVERFTGVPLDGISGTSVDCLLLNTAAGEVLFHGNETALIEGPCSQVKGVVNCAALGAKHFVAVTDAGIIFTRGEGELGQTGQGHPDDVETPFPLKVASQISVVKVGANHSVALTNKGTVYGWGTGYYGQHGGAVRRPQMVPRLLSFQKCKIVQIAVGDDFSLALATDGRIWSWGANDCGQLGLGDTKARFKPQVVGSTHTDVGDTRTDPLLIPAANNAVKTTYRSIGAGKAHAVACNGEGQLFAWGFNMQGQLGQGSSRKFATDPLQVDLSSYGDYSDNINIVEVDAAAFFSAARSVNGHIYTFGKFVTVGKDQPEQTNAGVPALVHRLSNAKVSEFMLRKCIVAVTVALVSVIISY